MNQGLVIDNLCHRFHTENGQTVDALNHLSLEVPAGQIVSVIGASGCGKSTLLSLIAGFDRPAQGEIALDGVSVVRKPSPDRCLVFQSPALFEWLTVLQNVMYGLKRQGVSVRTDVHRRWICWHEWDFPALSDSIRTNCRAVCSSASRWHVPW